MQREACTNHELLLRLTPYLQFLLGNTCHTFQQSHYLTSCTSCPLSHAASHVCCRVSPLAQAFFLGKSLSMLPPAFSDPATAPRDTGAGVAAGGVPHAPQDLTSILLTVVTTLSSSSSVPPGTSGSIMHSSRRCQGLSSNQDCFA